MIIDNFKIWRLALRWAYYLLGKSGLMFLVVFVCLSVCGQQYPNTYEWIGLKFYGGVLGGTMKNW